MESQQEKLVKLIDALKVTIDQNTHHIKMIAVTLLDLTNVVNYLIEKTGVTREELNGAFAKAAIVRAEERLKIRMLENEKEDVLETSSLIPE